MEDVSPQANIAGSTPANAYNFNRVNVLVQNIADPPAFNCPAVRHLSQWGDGGLQLPSVYRQ